MRWLSSRESNPREYDDHVSPNSGGSERDHHDYEDEDGEDTDSGVGSAGTSGYGAGAVHLMPSISTPGAARSVTHPPVAAPLCDDCRSLELAFFDPTCPGCRRVLNSPYTTPAHIFAILRQWVPQVQQNIELLVDQASANFYLIIS
jgi:hypothetical protein